MNKYQKPDGFTLVEIIVALGIFVTIAAIASGVFTSLVRSQGTSYRTQIATSQLRYLQDVLSRDVRESESVTCGTNSLTTTDSGAGITTTYTLTGNNLKRDGEVLSDLEFQSNGFRVMCHADGNTVKFVTVQVLLQDIQDPFELTVASRLPQTERGGQ